MEGYEEITLSLFVSIILIWVSITFLQIIFGDWDKIKKPFDFNE